MSKTLKNFNHLEVGNLQDVADPWDRLFIAMVYRCLRDLEPRYYRGQEEWNLISIWRKEAMDFLMLPHWGNKLRLRPSTIRRIRKLAKKRYRQCSYYFQETLRLSYDT